MRICPNMVYVQLVNCPDSPEVQPVRPIPEMIFVVGEEPVGVHVLTLSLIRSHITYL